MKITTIFTSALLLSFSSFATAQTKAPEAREAREAKAEMNLLENNFEKHLTIILPDLVKTLDEPEGMSAKIKSMIMQTVTEREMMKLTDDEKNIIAKNGEVDGFKKAQLFWTKLHQQFSEPKEAGKRKNAIPLLVASYLSKFNEKSSTLDQLLSVKTQIAAKKEIKRQLDGANRIKNLMAAKMLILEMMQAEHEKQELKIPERLKFTDDQGNKQDWIITEKGEDEQPWIISPGLSGGKYVIALRDGSAFFLTPKEAKEKYGIGK